MNLRARARGQPCLIRSPICNGNPETVVLCHYRMAGYSGTGLKPPDVMGAFGCSACHDFSDDRYKSNEYPRLLRRLWHAEAVLRTLALAHERGWVVIK